MVRIRRVDCADPGITRRRRGRGFGYVAPGGEWVSDPVLLARIRALSIPPAWHDVWICPIDTGHLQAVGTDAAGRRQYLYHKAWRTRRDQAKFDHMLQFAHTLPLLRERAAAHLGGQGLDRDRVLACAIRLLDLGFFRMGTEGYAEQNQTFGLATIQQRHVRLDGDLLTFDYAAKNGKRRLQSVVDPQVIEVVAALKRRRGGGPELLAYRRGRRWVDVRSEDINCYIKQQTGGEFTAKDFRTWSATVLAAVAPAASFPQARSRTGREEGDQPGGQGGRPLPGQHAGRLPRLLPRPPPVRPLPVGPDDRRRPRAARSGRRVRRARTPGGHRDRRARPH
jgi:DNA topoisomerase I